MKRYATILLCSAAYLAMTIAPSFAADPPKIFYRANTGVIGYDSSTAPGQTTNPGSGTGTTTPSALAATAPSSSSLAVAAGGTWNVVVAPTGGTGPYTFAATGVPTGISQVTDSATLTLSGVAASGVHAIKVAVTDKAGTRVETPTFSVVVAAPVAVGHRFWRVGVTDSATSRAQISELVFKDTSGSALPTPTNGVIISDSDFPIEGQWAFDGDLNSQWTSKVVPSASTPQHVGYSFAQPVTVGSIDLAGYSYTPYSPKGIYIQSSDDGLSWSTPVTHNGIVDLNKTFRNFSATVSSGGAAPFKATFSGSNHLYAVVGKKTSFPVGTYVGDPTGMSCSYGNASVAPTTSCVFENGRILFVVQPTSAGADYYNNIQFMKNGVATEQAPGFAYWFYGTDYANNDATPETPRTATATIPAGTEFHMTIGKPISLRLGTITGGEAGWLCLPTQGPQIAGLTCSFANNEFRLVGTPTAGGSVNFVLVRDGRQIREVGYKNFYATAADYPNNDATPDTPRGGTATFAAGPFATTAGDATGVLVGTYTGGEGGLLCYPNIPLPAGTTCTASGGEVRLKGTTVGSGSGFYLKLARDNRIIGESNFLSYNVAAAASPAPAAGHRYWRVGVTRTHSGRSIYMREITFQNGATNLVLNGANAISPNVPAVLNAFDQTVGSYGISAAPPSTAAPAYFGYDFGAATTVTNLGMMPFADGDDPTDFLVQWSDDNATWTTTATHTGVATWGTGNWVYKYFSTTVSSANAQ